MKSIHMVWGLIFASFTFNTATADTTKDVLDVLEKHPEKVMEAMQKGMQKKQEDASAKLRESVKSKLDHLRKLSLTLGKTQKDGVIAFIDPICPYCQQWATEALKTKDTTFHILPVSLLGSEMSPVICKLMIAAFKTDAKKFPKFLEVFHKDRSKMNEGGLLDILKSIGYDASALKKMIDAKDFFTPYEELLKTFKLTHVPALFIVKGDKIADFELSEGKHMEEAYKKFMA